ncbi:MAG: polymer-forming cytoskeletal protein [Anaerolineae bacterium]|nr:polymer-forming cytoskeletal protein [Anaerolineae bacterium]
MMSFFGGRRQQENNEDRAAPSRDKPAAPPPTRQPVGFETVLGANTQISGDFKGAGNARFDGTLEGSLEIDGNILIGETARITADINARNISIAGAVRGNVNGNKVQILRTGRVWGDISAAAITTEEGAFIDGKITMVSHEAALHGMDAPPLAAPEEEPVLDEPDFLAEVDAAREAEEEVEEAEGEMVLEFSTDDQPEDEEIPPDESDEGMLTMFGEFGSDEEEADAGLDIEDHTDEDMPRYNLD